MRAAKVPFEVKQDHPDICLPVTLQIAADEHI
jgi:hypothetical protein